MAFDSQPVTEATLRTDAATSDGLLERLLVFIISVSGIGLVLGLSGHFLAPLVLCLAVLCTWAYHRKAPMPRDGARSLRLAHVIPILLVALVFRLAPYTYVLGGQDQGVYTNMAAELVRTGDVAVTDAEYDRLAAVGVQAAYVRDNYSVPFLPGVYTTRLSEKPELEFQFYHVFPVWLATFGGILGLGSAGYALTFLALASIVFFQRLAAELSGSARIGAAAGLLLALNPLHAFFSKFPVTEVPTLGFSAAGFCFLALHALAPVGFRQVRWLVLSALAFACLFLTRISGFMYLPLLLLVAMAGLVLDPDRQRARAISAWALATVVAYLLSVVYGLVWSNPYSVSIYQASFSLVAGAGWAQALLAIGSVTALAWTLAWRRPGGAFGRMLAFALPWLRRCLGPALLLVVLLGAYKAYRLGFTSRYVGDAWLSQFPGVVAEGWSSLGYSSLVVAMLYLGPLLFLAMLVLGQRRLPVPASYLLFFLCCFLAYAALLNWTVPYQPYYARYLVSELVPYAILFAACSLAWIHHVLSRRLLAAVLVVSGAYFMVLSSAQVGKQENEGALSSLSRLAQVADDGDVILLDGFHGQGFEPKEVKTTLVYTLGRHVVTVGDRALSDVGYLQAVASAYEDVFLATSASEAPAGFVLMDSVTLHARNFERSARPPSRLVTVIDANVNVFRLDRVLFNVGARQDFPAVGDARVLSQVGARRNGRLFAGGRAGFLLYGPYISLPAGRYRLVVRGEAGKLSGMPNRLDVSVDRGSRQLAATDAPSVRANLVGALEFDVPDGGVNDLEVRLQVAAGSTASVQGYTIQRVR